jgi:hypothetical protein
MTLLVNQNTSETLDDKDPKPWSEASLAWMKELPDRD